MNWILDKFLSYNDHKYIYKETRIENSSACRGMPIRMYGIDYKFIKSIHRYYKCNRCLSGVQVSFFYVELCGFPEKFICTTHWMYGTVMPKFSKYYILKDYNKNIKDTINCNLEVMRRACL